MAPEQVRGDLVSPATDVWGIGTLLFEATTARQPFNATDEDTGFESATGPEGRTDSGDDRFETDTDLDSYDQVLRRADPIRTHRRVPKVFANAVDSCLDPDPEKRPTIEGLAELLDEAVRGL